MQPVVSIIMPTYNRAGYIRDTISSIIAQTFTDWELLVLDDGSDDDTKEVVASVQDARVIYIQFERIAITGKLKNEGISRSKGEYIAFMDSDDLWPPAKLEQQVKLLSENPDAGFSFTNWQNFSNINNPGKPVYDRPEGTEVMKMFLAYCRGEVPVNIQTVMCRRSCIEQSGYFNTDKIFTDYSFIGKLAYYFKALIMYEPLLLRRLHDSNNVNTNWALDYAEYQDTIKTFIKDGWLSMSDVSDKLFLSYINLGEKYLSVADRQAALNSYLKSWKYRPLSIIPAKKLIKALFLPTVSTS